MTKNKNSSTLNNSSKDNLLDPVSYSMSELEVFNWGPFSGLHQIYFHASGSALIGQTGSGKTTLVDAIMSLICAKPRYNLASTGGFESDRDLMSYVRGVTGKGGDDEMSHVARPAQTTTGLSVVFSRGEEKLRLTGLLWIDSSSNSQTDMKRLWILDKSNHQGLTDYLQQLKDQGIRGLKIQLKEAVELVATDNKKTYLTQLRRFFEVNENAFVLLNRAAGLKQLNNIDELFRELVLDDRSAFKRASEVTKEFDALKGIHQELQTAKIQQQSLLPIEDTYKQYQVKHLKLLDLNIQQQILPTWYAKQGYRLWSEKIATKQTEISLIESNIESHQSELCQQQAVVDDAYQRYQQLGGSNIEDLKRQINEKQQRLSELKQNIQDYQRLCQSVSFSKTINATQLSSNLTLAKKKINSLESEQKILELKLEKKIQLTRNSEEKAEEIKSEIVQVKTSPDSNIPNSFLQFQKTLAEYLKLSVEELPFIGQCIEVQDKTWQGAIERAIGSHRLRLVIADEYMRRALDWINQRNNQLHVRLMNADDSAGFKRQALVDGFCQKLTFKNNNHKQAVKYFLSSIDRHCVDDIQKLESTAFAMTREGLMSGKRGLFEKQDQRKLNQGWLTGFDNHARLAELEADFNQENKMAIGLRKQLQSLKQTQKNTVQELLLLESFKTINFTDLNLTGTQQSFEQLQERLQQLQNPQSDTAKAEADWQQAAMQLKVINETLNDFIIKLKLTQNDLQQAEKQAVQAQDRIDLSITKNQVEALNIIYQIINLDQINELATLERDASQVLQVKINRQQKLSADLQTRLTKLMVLAQQNDHGALSETGTELEDIDDYLSRLKSLTEEALPAKLERFLNYLNQSSDQGVTQLLTRIDNEVAIIEERIEELNATMQQVDFQPGRYLQLVPQKIRHESIQSLQKSQRDLRSAALLDDQGESHYKALLILIEQLRNAVERKRTKAAQALLDPRYRLQFSVAIIDRKTQVVLENRTGSQGGSGGEKEIITSYILTASLSYALCPKGRTTPLFGTVILDEAFSKSSQAVAARIIAALKQFGLHPLFVTPNKEMQLLRAHTASAVLVHRKEQRSQALSLAWKEIDKHVLKRQSLKIDHLK
jgi:uncharacterized protein YPO0396